MTLTRMKRNRTRTRRSGFRIRLSALGSASAMWRRSFFRALRENIDQILSQSAGRVAAVQSRDGRVGAGFQRLRGGSCNLIATACLACTIPRSDRSHALGRTLREAFDGEIAVIKEEVRTENGRRIEVSVDFIHDDMTRQGLGALVTLRDLESVEAIESELDASRGVCRLSDGWKYVRRRPRGEESDQRHRGTSRTAEDTSWTAQSPNAMRHLDARRGDSPARPRGSDAGGFLPAC